MKKYFNTQGLVFAAIVAAMYAALTLAGYGFAYGPVQFRFSEVLVVLPFFAPMAAPGLFVGCLIANLFGGFGLLDIVFGSLATLYAGILTAKMPVKWLAPLPPVIINGIVIGVLMALSYNPENVIGALPIHCSSITVSELVICYGLGLPLLIALQKYVSFGTDSTVQSKIWVKRTR